MLSAPVDAGSELIQWADPAGFAEVAVCSTGDNSTMTRGWVQWWVPAPIRRRWRWWVPALQRRWWLVIGIAVVLVGLGAGALITRNAGWWPNTQRREISKQFAANAWLFTAPTAELVCRTHWGGSQSMSIRADGKEYALNTGPDTRAADEGFRSVQELVDRASNRKEGLDYITAVNDLSEEVKFLCH